MGGTIAVIGGHGHTGRFVVDEIARRGLEPIALGRDRVDLNDPRSLDNALAGAAAVINCAGPFLDTADSVVQAALRAGIHYFVVTAEQASAPATLEEFDAPARRAGIAVVPAAGFFGGFGDLLATAAVSDWAHADELSIFIALDRWWPTAGTRRTGARNTVPRVVLRAGELVPQERPPYTTVWTFGEPFGEQDVVETPLSETVLLSRHLAVANAENFINQQPLNDLRDAATPPPTRDDAMGRSRQHFLVEAVARCDGLQRRAIARGRDIYALTAPLVVEAAERIITGNGAQHGAFALAGAFEPRAFLGALSHSYPSLEISYQ
jgi:hypothetical protein